MPHPAPVRDRLTAAWSRFWFAPEPATSLAVARIVLAANALWIVVSRNNLPAVMLWPREIWGTILPERRLRFFLVFDVRVENVLWILLIVALVMTIAGVATRWAAFASGLLLYHFGPLETIMWTGNPYLRGYTIPALGLLIVAAAPSAGRFGRGDRSPHNRWPLVLLQVLFSQIYFFAAWAKLLTSGIDWMQPSNIRHYVLGIDQFLNLPHSALNVFIAEHDWVLLGISVSGMLIDALFPVMLFSRRWRWIILPIAVVYHVLNGVIFHIWFQNAPLLLMFVPWDRAVESARSG